MNIAIKNSTIDITQPSSLNKDITNSSLARNMLKNNQITQQIFIFTQKNQHREQLLHYFSP